MTTVIVQVRGEGLNQSSYGEQRGKKQAIWKINRTCHLSVGGENLIFSSAEFISVPYPPKFSLAFPLSLPEEIICIKLIHSVRWDVKYFF